MATKTRGPIVAYTIVTSELGPMLVAATDAGVAAVLFGDASGLLAALSRELPGTELVRDDGALAQVASAVAEAAAGRPHPRLPLDLRGTEFQRRVWDELLKVQRGETVTYAQLAERIGRPTAVRAVAGAVAANRIGVLVPCHRVVRSDGSIGGFKWGADRKRTLLEREMPKP